MLKLLIRGFLWLHNFSYKTISFLAIRDNGGIHPKHDIVRYRYFFLEHISTTDRVLDIGSSYGELAAALAEKAQSVTGIEIEKHKAKKAATTYSRPNLSFIAGDATAYPFNGTFDIITLSNVLEHIEHRIDFLNKIKNLADTLLIRVPLITRDWLPTYKKELGIEYRLDCTHFIEYTEKSFAEELHAAGLEITSSYVHFGEFYVVAKPLTR